MIAIAQSKVENAILKVIGEVNDTLKIGADINAGCRPGNIGISSQILLALTFQIEQSLAITIPNNAYIFYDYKERKQLSIQEAAQKLLKVARNGN